jgi:hypothetical protein
VKWNGKKLESSLHRATGAIIRCNPGKILTKSEVQYIRVSGNIALMLPILKTTPVQSVHSSCRVSAYISAASCGVRVTWSGCGYGAEICPDRDRLHRQRIRRTGHGDTAGAFLTPFRRHQIPAGCNHGRTAAGRQYLLFARRSRHDMNMT